MDNNWRKNAPETLHINRTIDTCMTCAPSNKQTRRAYALFSVETKGLVISSYAQKDSGLTGQALVCAQINLLPFSCTDSNENLTPYLDGTIVPAE